MGDAPGGLARHPHVRSARSTLAESHAVEARGSKERTRLSPQVEGSSNRRVRARPLCSQEAHVYAVFRAPHSSFDQGEGCIASDRAVDGAPGRLQKRQASRAALGRRMCRQQAWTPSQRCDIRGCGKARLDGISPALPTPSVMQATEEAEALTLSVRARVQAWQASMQGRRADSHSE